MGKYPSCFRELEGPIVIAKSGMMNFAESGIDEAPLQSHYWVPLHDLCCLRSFKERRLQVCANWIGPGASRWKGGGASRKVLREPHCREARSLEPLDISWSIPILPPIFREVHNSTRNYRLSRIPSGIAILHYEAKWSLRPISLKNAIRWSDASTFSCDVNSPINRITRSNSCHWRSDAPKLHALTSPMKAAAMALVLLARIRA